MEGSVDVNRQDIQAQETPPGWKSEGRDGTLTFVSRGILTHFLLRTRIRIGTSRNRREAVLRGQPPAADDGRLKGGE